MQYRQFPGMDWKPSALGFGCMRLPTADKHPLSPNIDEEEAIRIIRYAVEQGVNYLDTAYTYHGGNSEVVLGKALRDGYRDEVKIATKSPTWLMKSPEDFDKYLNEQLSKLQTDYIDFYLLHGLDKKNWENVILKLGLLEKAEKAKEDGRVKAIGFSFHDDYDAFEPIVNGFNDWDCCLLQYNYMDINNQAGTKGVKYAADKGLGVMVMEPLLGGKLARPPRNVLEIFEGFTVKRSPADWALQWVWNQSEVSLVLSGMSSMQQVKENLHSAEASAVNSFNENELHVIQQVREKYREKAAIPCTGCNYCLPCPNGVAISQNFFVV